MKLQLYKSQLDFVQCKKPFVGFVGGRGAGKSMAGAMRLLLSVLQNKGLYGMYAPTYPLLRDTILRSFLTISAPYIAAHSESKGQITIRNGSEIICRSLDEPERARGPSIRGGIVDEASLCSVDAFNILIGCLRYEGEQGWLGCTFTPKGPAHWTANIFNNPLRTDVECFHASTKDNPFNPENFHELLARQYTTAFAQQEIEGKFVNLGGAVYKSTWFKFVDTLPSDITFCRAWDFAATEKQLASDDPDFTVGGLVGIATDGRIYIANICRGRYPPAEVESLPIKIAEQDGKKVKIILEQEGGAGGKIFVNGIIRKLQGYIVRTPDMKGDKMARSMPLFSQAEQGNVYLLRAPWNIEFLSEVDSFGSSGHDDQIDAVSHAYNALLKKQPAMIIV